MRCLTGKKRKYQEGMMGAMCWCLCTAVQDVLEVLAKPARNPFSSLWRSFFMSAGVREGLEGEHGRRSVKPIETFYLTGYQAIQVDLT